MKLIGNAVVGQSGGPTAAINATLAGVIEGCRELHGEGTLGKLYGMKNGIEGLLSEELIDISFLFENDTDRELLKCTPAAALGSCRRRLKSHDVDADTYDRLLEIFKKYDIRYFFYIGGNDSMDTVYKLSEYAKGQSYELRVIGVPKTIDNDLQATDHTPGFGSAAKFIATAVKEMRRDVSVYQVKAVTIVEIMGRDAGWLTAASALPSVTGDGPDLVYLPEKPFSIERFIDDVNEILAKKPAVLVCVSEGLRFADGSYVAASGAAADGFGHVQLSGTGKVLEHTVKEKIGCKVRSVELNLPQRCASHIASLTDIQESVGVGRSAAILAREGKTGVMATILRAEGDTYGAEYGYADIALIANEVKTVPDAYINAEGNGITDEGINYILPLICGELSVPYENGMPKHFKFS